MPYIVFSLDYDGCSAILFEASRQSILVGSKTPGYEAFESTFINIADAAKEIFSETLDRLNALNHGVPEVFCGSNRQSRWLDDRTRINSGSADSAFDELRGYCREKGWVFNPFLLADKYLGKPDGYSIDNPAATSDRSINNNVTWKHNEWDPAKIDILTEQIKRASLNARGDVVDFYFIDDDHKDRIIPGLKTYFLDCPAVLPSNVRLHFIKYDWFKILEEFPSLIGRGKDEIKIKANSLMQPQGFIKRCDIAGGPALTECVIFDLPLAEAAPAVAASEALPVVAASEALPAVAASKALPAVAASEPAAGIAASADEHETARDNPLFEERDSDESETPDEEGDEIARELEFSFGSNSHFTMFPKASSKGLDNPYKKAKLSTR
jgi:hypothetical protein